MLHYKCNFFLFFWKCPLNFPGQQKHPGYKDGRGHFTLFFNNTLSPITEKDNFFFPKETYGTVLFQLPYGYPTLKGQPRSTEDTILCEPQYV